MPWTFEPFTDHYGTNHLRIVALMPQPNNEGPIRGLGKRPDMGRWFTTYAIKNEPHGSQKMFFFNTLGAIRSAAGVSPNENVGPPSKWNWREDSLEKFMHLDAVLACGRVVDIDDEGGGNQVSKNEVIRIANANIGRVLDRLWKPKPPTHILLMGSNARVQRGIRSFCHG